MRELHWGSVEIERDPGYRIKMGFLEKLDGYLAERSAAFVRERPKDKERRWKTTRVRVRVRKGWGVIRERSSIEKEGWMSYWRKKQGWEKGTGAS